MRIQKIPILAATLAVAFAPGASAEAGTTGMPPVAHYDEASLVERAFSAVKPNVRRRPSVQVTSDYYVYGPGTGFTEPRITVSLDTNGFTDPVSLWLYWEDRDSQARRWYNVGSGWSNAERDLLGVASRPVALFVPGLADFRLFGPGSAFGPLSGVPDGIGLYQIVLEVRDAAGQEVIARGNAMFSQVSQVVTVSGNVGASQTWTSDKVYYLATPVYVQNGATVTIEPGTVVLGSTAGQGTFIVLAGGKLIADGDSRRPIVFTSENPVGQRNNGDWGGLVISGNAPVNGGVRQGEGDSGSYGGDNPNDNSGVLRFVRVEFGGVRFNETNELNGIALQGVGKGTTVEFLQIVGGADDGIEFFGGTVDAKYIYVLNAEDDSLDWAYGWTGRAQFVCAVQQGPANDQGIEADNDADNNDLEPRSSPTIYNATFVGNASVGGSQGSHGWMLRRGTAVTMRNFILTDFREFGVVVDGTVSQSLVGGDLTIENGVIFGTGAGLTPSPEVEAYLQSADAVVFQDPALPGPHNLVPDIAPLGGSPARNAGLVEAPPGGFFENAGYLGCVNPQNPWIDDGWTVSTLD